MNVSKQQFRKLFLRALEVAATNADQVVGTKVPRSFVMDYARSGTAMTVDESVDRLYVDEAHFYKFIDLAIMEVFSDKCMVFVRPSGHPPCPWGETYDPSEWGPFKQMGVNVKDHRPAS